MTDLASILPSFPVHKYSHLLPSLERHLVTTVDLLTLDSLDIAKRALLPVLDVKKLCAAVLEAFQVSLGLLEDNSSRSKNEILKRTGEQIVNNWSTISVLDDGLDYGLRGGIPTGSITEITGESGAGKTQFLVTLLLAAQLPPPHGLSSPSLYISTESALPVTRIRQLLLVHPAFKNIEKIPSLDQIISIVTPDLESQDHILYFQVPVAVRRYGIRLLIIDSIASNYRAEFDRDDPKPGANMAKRSQDLIKLGHFLRKLAVELDIAVVVANQVADRVVENSRVENTLNSGELPAESPRSLSSPDLGTSSLSEDSKLLPNHKIIKDFLSLDHQQRWFTGWGDDPHPSAIGPTHLKTPSLGLIWSNQIACRIALIKKPIYKRSGECDSSELVMKWRRWQKVVFASHAPESGVGVHSAVEFEIRGDGIRSLDKQQDKNEIEPETGGQNHGI
ncbi:DNA repair protein rhp57 [Erysiphe neolycopersici]|uniref:DNA repair protein rhp57 n=1 Tax=Erysiphe neolycopersici TaxID=212602 RepID=A0A420HZ84_9PEZI|nr:DNA repair protein rhp57 [Erysiphe neolycopersici]